jgi:hypothetical protein
MAFKLLTNDEAMAFGLQIVNAYRQGHDLPIIGTGVKLPVTPKRAKNKAKQAVFRAKTPRLTVWLTPDYQGITDGLADKIAAIGQAKKQWRAAIGILHRHQRELAGFLSRQVSLTITTTNTAERIQKRIAHRNLEIARLKTAVQVDELEVDAKYQAYQDTISP